MIYAMMQVLCLNLSFLLSILKKFLLLLNSYGEKLK